jgi:PrcB C-terminal
MLPITLTALTLVAGVDAESADAIIARARWPHARVDVKSPGKDKVQLVLRSANELVAAVPGAVEKTATGSLAKELKVKDIDWTKQMVVVVSGGSQRTGGYRVEVTALEIKDKTMTVKWKLHAPKGIATQSFTHPAEAVLVPKFAGKVVFDPAHR